MNNQTLSGILSLSKRKGLQNMGAFTFVELIISISILILLTVIAFTALNKNTNNANNAKIEAGTITLKNALLSYLGENKKLPKPNGNLNYFKKDSSYGHYGDTDNFGVYGSITEKTLQKKYLDSLPLDPVSNHYFSYGKTIDNKYFEIALVLRDSESDSTKLDGNYPGEYGPISLIREYNGSIFVSDKSKIHLPYNPNEHVLTATDQDGKIYYAGTKIENNPKSLTLYFSDGSVSELATGSTLNFSEIKYKNNENNLLTSVKLFLFSGEILTKATALNPEGSDFEIYTADTTAAVRGTIFSVSYTPNRTPKTIISVLKGQVEIQHQNNTTENLNPIEGTGLKIKNLEKNISFSNTGTIDDITKEKLKRFARIYFEENLPKGMSLSEILNGETEEEEIEEEQAESCTNGITVGTECYELYAKAEYNGFDNKDLNTETNIGSKKDKLDELLKFDLINKKPDSYSFLDWHKVNESETVGYNNSIIYNNSTESLCSTKVGFKNTSNKTCIVPNGLAMVGNSNYFLKYSNLNLGDNFAIEMNIYFPDSTPGETRYLFQLGDNHKLYASHDGKLHLKIDSHNEPIKDNIYDGNFHKITAIKNGNEYQLLVDGEEKISFNSSNPVGTNLYIGSNKDKDNQLNSIIDYVRIYKKEP